MQTKKGIIQFYLPERGYGYIRDPETRAEYHFTHKGLLEPVKDKDWVLFDIQEKGQRLKVINIRKNPKIPSDQSISGN